MPLFTRILDFKRDFLARLRDKRVHSRYRVGEAFPLKAVVNLIGDENAGRKQNVSRGTGRDWGGRVGDLSDSGLNIYLPPAAITSRGEPSVVRLTLENHELVIPCTVAHFRVYHSHSLCGLKLQFEDFPLQKTYLQLVEAVRLGASFAPSARGGAGRTPAGFVRRYWRSANKTLLTEWREVGRPETDHFELTLGDHSVQGNSTRPGLEVHSRSPLPKSGSTGVSPTVETEVRQLFRWVVANLPKSVPADLRTFLARVSLQNQPVPVRAAATRGTPAQWQPPKPKT